MNKWSYDGLEWIRSQILNSFGQINLKKSESVLLARDQESIDKAMIVPNRSSQILNILVHLISRKGHLQIQDK